MTAALTDKHQIALLPGLDGTGELFFPVVPFLEKHFEVHVVRYTDELTLNDYVESTSTQLPMNVPVSLVAESFSGPVAITLLANNSLDFQASVLSATFCKSPLPFLTQLSEYLPETLFTSNPVSMAFLDLLVTGSDANSEVRSKARELVEKVSPSQFRNRTKLVNKVNVTEQLKHIDVPLLYIQATKDSIVYPESGAEMMRHAKDMKIVEVDGSHMILQTQPEKCAELIVQHVTSNASAGANKRRG